MAVAVIALVSAFSIVLRTVYIVLRAIRVIDRTILRTAVLGTAVLRLAAVALI